jgi:hypothetical protein
MVDEADVVLEERIAEGSFGFVFKGTYKGCKVAVKLFKINFNAGQSATNMLRSLKDEMVGVLFHGVLLLITQLLTSLPLLLTPAPPHSRLGDYVPDSAPQYCHFLRRLHNWCWHSPWS